MKIIRNIFGLSALTMLSLLAACAESEYVVEDKPLDDSGIIHIGGVQYAEVETSLAGLTTRADGDGTPANSSVDAETVEWLLGPLFGGLDITYGAKGKPETKKVAILQLLKNDGATGMTSDDIRYSSYTGPNGEKIAEYSFKYLGTDTDAKWYDNGEHFFQGVFVPEKLRYDSDASETQETVNGSLSSKAPNLKIDQSKDVKTDVDANYTLLERYLGMPADATIHATVGRIKLPFRHRLARVLAYVLIDPTMGTGVTIKGYKKAADGITDVTTEDASTSAIRFCNVEVLAGVEQKAGTTSGHSELTPRWDKSRKVIPHFVEESGSKNSLGEEKNADFIMFYNTELKTYIFPANDDAWAEAKSKWDTAYTTALGGSDSAEDKRKAADVADTNSGYKRTVYGVVPCYDLIVRPTYKTEEMVMYDEDLTGTSKQDLVEKINTIDFEITLNNGLEYYKSFEFDLDANFQTIVYLRINRESIDYNSSGAEVWKEKVHDDGYYGVNNQNGNTLSYAGSSWQRAYRIGSRNPNVTDGHYYGQDDATDDNAVQDDDVMPWYPQYVDQTKWIQMFAEARAGGLHHGDYFILDSDITIDASQLPADFVFTGHLDGQDHTITLTGMGEPVVDTPAWDEDNYVEAGTDDYSSSLYIFKDEVYIPYVMPQLYSVVHHDAVDATYFTTVDEYNAAHAEDEGFSEISAEVFETLSQEQKLKSPAVEENDEYVLADPQPTIEQMLEGGFYEKIDESSFVEHNPTLYVNKPIHHDAITHMGSSTLFAGLNGAYDAAIGEANVHSEKGILVPYVDPVTLTGWRAEVINTRIAGADMFPSSVFETDGSYDVTKVSGYIYNCWKGSEKIKSHTPSLPKYK